MNQGRTGRTAKSPRSSEAEYNSNGSYGTEHFDGEIKTTVPCARVEILKK